MEKLNELLELNVNNMTENKGGFTYLSWALAWKEFIKIYPKAKYEIKKNDQGLPVFGSKELGYMSYTTVTVDDITHEMWLPVLDFRNKPLLTPNTFDINKTVMRCLTKNLAMFGLGLYIYAGEDLPVEQKQKLTLKQEIWNLIHDNRVPEQDRNDYIESFKGDPMLITASKLKEIKAKYFNA